MLYIFLYLEKDLPDEDGVLSAGLRRLADSLLSKITITGKNCDNNFIKM